jgi:tRNA(Ile)-lysidine synthase
VISIDIDSGKYIVAVSGGVDSMVLLDLLRKRSDLSLVVAHFDHGIRSDSRQDRELVARIATSHNIPFEYEEGRLGLGASEELARTARYDFLRHMCKKYNASAIITAHQRDDLLETAFINVLRGTGWRGISSLRSVKNLLRPMLHISKAEIREYAASNSIVWREDSTNNDASYLRNHVRNSYLRHASESQREKMYEYIVRQSELTDLIDDATATWIRVYAKQISESTTLPRHQLIMISSHVAHELLQAVLRQKSGKSLERPVVERALLFCKVAKHGKVFQLDSRLQLRIDRGDVIVELRSA